MWLLAGPIKSNWPNVRTWSVFQYSAGHIFQHRANFIAIASQKNSQDSKFAVHKGHHGLPAGRNYRIGHLFQGLATNFAKEAKRGSTLVQANSLLVPPFPFLDKSDNK